MEIEVGRQKDGLMLSALLLQEAAGVPVWAIREVIKKREVRIDGVRIAGDVRVKAGQKIRVFWPKSVAAEQNKPPKLPEPEVIYEDENILLMNKPQGIASQNEERPYEGDTALTRAAAYCERQGLPREAVKLCHRLDVQTGGLLLFTRNEEAYSAAVEAFSERTFKKYYTCLVKGCPAKEAAVMHAYLRKDAQLSRVCVTDYPARGAMEIVTAYRTLEAGECSRLEVELITGRTHQIRAHLAHIGHPILGDDKYGDRAANRRYGLRRQQLWATRLEFHAGGCLAYLEGRVFEVNAPF